MDPEPSPSERYASFRARTRSPELESFRAGLRFDLDAFQAEACRSLETGRSVLVAAPTGAGKTIVAEFAIHLALGDATSKAFYTTPMKALSNQKFREFRERYGEASVGLLTGDTNINSQARIVVMTTEVLRNMIYADSPLLADLATVVMDEVHYLADRYRGAVWEEVILHLPERVRLVSLSATVSNAEEFGDWLQTVRGDTDVVVSEERPVPLDQHVLAGRRLIGLFEGPGAGVDRVNPELLDYARRTAGLGGGRARRGRRGRRPPLGPGPGRADRPEVVDLLESRMLLPAICFIFSRKGCDQAVRQVLRSGVRLTSREQRAEIRDLVEERCRTLPDEDLGVLGYWEWLDGLEHGVAAHHAGLLPAFKEVVEELFRRRLVTLVFATETLALGINMPARTVVLERLEKFNGEARVPITPGEYTQLTGRAGRRGIDVEGHAVIQWRGDLDPQAVAALASKRSYPLNSSFRPGYNMAVNLIDRYGTTGTREILESSFAQFQADRAVVGLARKVRGQEASLAGYEESMRCHLGDFTEYAALRRELSDLERRRVAPGEGERARRRRADALADLRERMRAHPCHACPEREQHARWAERWWRLQRKTAALRGQIRGRTSAIATAFDRVTEVLLEAGYLSRDGSGTVVLTPAGRSLRRIYGERDLLVAECLREGVWGGLDVPSLAALACALVYEPRRERDEDPAAWPPQRPLGEALERTDQIWSRLDDLERAARLRGSDPISAGLCRAMHRWARGGALARVLEEAGMSAGDFVRWSKQTVDLLDQLRTVAEPELAASAHAAMDAVRRGIVAAGAE